MISKIFLLLAIVTLLISCQANNPDQFKELNKESSIIGGENARDGEFPFLVNIWLNAPKDSFVDHLCGGSLIHPRWVLTAAHCVLEDASEKDLGLIKASNFNLYIGSSHISGKGGKALKVRSIVVHPEFSWPRHDVALIELSTPVTEINPVVLNTNPLSVFSGKATTAGWGLTDRSGKVDAQLLQRIDLDLLDRKSCEQDSFPKRNKWDIGNETICTKTYENRTASCPGDSGGPLLQFIDGNYVQIGIVSWGSACRGIYPKVQSDVEGYADVGDAYPWIQSIIK